MKMIQHLSASELKAGLPLILNSPKDKGVLEMIVRRPERGSREVLSIGRLEVAEGLTGDSWIHRSSSHTVDHKPDTNRQLTIMNSRVIQLLSQDKNRWILAGDQLFIDLDLSRENLAPGTRLTIGDAMIEVTDAPHTGCHKFVDNFGADAAKFVNVTSKGNLRLRGIYAKVVKSGTIQTGDLIEKYVPSN